MRPPEEVFRALIRSIDRPDHPFQQHAAAYEARQNQERVPISEVATGSFKLNRGSSPASARPPSSQPVSFSYQYAKQTQGSVLRPRAQQHAGPNVAQFAVHERHPWYMIDPRSSRFMPTWDAITAFTLILSALFTPFEIAFLGAPSSYTDRTFFLNRFVDLIFIGDMAVNMVLFQSISDRYGDRWITNHATIVRRYLRGWFAIDFVSTAVSIVDFITIAGVRSVGSLKVLRVLRVLRLIKMIRLAKSSRIILHFEIRHHFDYAALSLARAGIYLLLCTHWSGCLFALGSSFTRPTPEFTWLGQQGYCVNATNPDFDLLGLSPRHIAIGEEYAWQEHLAGPGGAWGPLWVFAYEPPQGRVGWLCLSPGSLYAVSTYWAAMTITSIGYGDVAATRFNAGEQGLVSMLMLFSALLWGQVVATFCSLMASMQESKLANRSRLDHLNSFMAKEALPPPLRWRMREFFFKTKHLRDASKNRQLFLQMSPRLQAETLWEINKLWLSRVRFLVGMEPEFIAAICMSLEAKILSPDDVIYGNEELFVIYRGMALYGGRVLSSGAVWGEDMLLECESLRSTASAKALSYLETNKIGREQILRIARSYPSSYMRLRKYIGFLALRRQVQMIASIEQAVRRDLGLRVGERSFGLSMFFESAEATQQPKIDRQRMEQKSGLDKEMRDHIKATMKDAPEPLARFFAAAVASKPSQKAAAALAGRLSRHRADCIPLVARARRLGGFTSAPGPSGTAAPTAANGSGMIPGMCGRAESTCSGAAAESVQNGAAEVYGGDDLAPRSACDPSEAPPRRRRVRLNVGAPIRVAKAAHAGGSGEAATNGPAPAELRKRSSRTFSSSHPASKLVLASVEALREEMHEQMSKLAREQLESKESLMRKIDRMSLLAA